MDERNEFRITVMLTAFFADHRSAARVFVQKNIKLISELQDKISRIFGISNFYLSAEKLYLPAVEDVRILKENDIVWALPITETNSIISHNLCVQSPTLLLENTSVKQRKKRRREAEYVEINDCENLEVENIKETSKKKKKSKVKDIINDFEKKVVSSTPIETVAENTEIKKKKKRKKDKTNEDNDVTEPSNVECENKNDFIVKEKNDDANHTTHEIQHIESSVQPTEDLATEVNNYGDLDEIPSNEKRPSTARFSNMQKFGLGALLNSLRGSDVISVTSDAVSDCTSITSEQFITKRKRKRTRNRRSKKTNESSETPLSSDPKQSSLTQLSLKPLKIEAQPKIHLRFDNTNGDCDDAPENHLNGFCNNAESEHVNCSDKRSETFKSEDRSRDSIGQQAKATENFEEALFPIETTEIPNAQKEASANINDIIPSGSEINLTEIKFDDLIAFKVLKITENYTPEPSSYILGKVKGLDGANARITMNIISGVDQLDLPKGKFYIDLDNAEQKEVGEKQNSENVDIFKEFHMSEILEAKKLSG